MGWVDRHRSETKGWSEMRVGAVGATHNQGQNRMQSGELSETMGKVADATGASSAGRRFASPTDTLEHSIEEETNLEHIVEGLNQTLHVVDKRLQFSIHEETGRVHVKVIDGGTEEVLREIPPEKILDLVGRIHELVGLLIDETV